MIHIVSMIMAVVLGFMIHRIGLCMVRLVAEILSNRTAYILAATIKSILVVLALSLAAAWLILDELSFYSGYQVNVISIGAGFLFGVGAAINGGCAFSTFTHLANGNLAMILTLIGFSFGVGLLAFFGIHNISLKEVDSLLTGAPPYLLVTGTILLWFFILGEAVRLIRIQGKKATLRQRFLPPSYRLSTAALFMGLSGGGLFLMHDSWTYTFILKEGIRSLKSPHIVISWNYYWLFASLFAGMVFSALERGSFRPRWKHAKTSYRQFLGGMLMGIAVIFVPGGNDTLILKSIPALSPHALPVFAALLLGVASTLGLRYLVSGKLPLVVCTKDICQ